MRISRSQLAAERGSACKGGRVRDADLSKWVATQPPKLVDPVSGSADAHGRVLAPWTPSYAALVVAPFLRFLRDVPEIPRDALARAEAFAPDARLPAETVHHLVQAAIGRTGDPSLGLKAALAARRGDYGVLELSAASADSIADGLACIVRFSPLVNDTMLWEVTEVSDHVQVRMRSTGVLPTAVMDHQVGLLFVFLKSMWPQDASHAIAVHRKLPQPADSSSYHSLFGHSVMFEAAFDGLSFAKECLAYPPRGADAPLHRVLKQHAELLLSSVPRVTTLSERVCAMISQELSQGAPALESVARRLLMSKRTLGRRLELENVTYLELVETARRSVALHYVAHSQASLAEVSRAAGFSSVAAFHRAFRRWTQQTPQTYRRSAWERSVGKVERPA